MDEIVNGLFIADVFINFLCAYENEDKNIEFSLKKIGSKYLNSWFVIDLVACIPVDKIIMVVAGTDESENQYNLLRLARLPRLYRLVRMVRLMRLLKMGQSFKKLFESLRINQGVAKLVGVLLTVLFLIHFIACFWYWIADFFQIAYAESVPDDDRENYWLVNQGLEDESNGVKYLAAVYWAF